MKILICLLISLSGFADDAKIVKAKEVDSKKTPPSLRYKKEAPAGKDIDTDAYKNLELRKAESVFEPGDSTCRSVGGVIYKKGTSGYDSCEKEQDIYIPTGSEHKEQ